MKQLNKLFNILMVFAILLTNFLPPFVLKVNALEDEKKSDKVEKIDMSKHYKLFVYYADDKVPIGSYESYEEAKGVMNTLYSSASVNPTIEIGSEGIVIDTAYGIVHMDSPNGVRSIKDNIISLYASASSAFYGRQDHITYVAGTWGVDAAFLEFDPSYGAIKVKISGVTGWLKYSQVSIVPIATYYGATSLYPNNYSRVRITATDNINIRTGAGTSYSQVPGNTTAVKNREYRYFPSKTIKIGDYTWYYIEYEPSKYGYIASKNENWVVEVNTLLTDTYYYANNNILRHHIHMGLRYYDYDQTLGTAPFYYSAKGVRTYYLKNSTSITNRYLSFDGNYFYTNYKDMIDDYRKGEYKKALNYEHPHYAYFMYLPSRSKTNMTEYDINQAVINTGKTSGLTHEPSYYYDNNANLLHGLGTESVMYNIGKTIIAASNKYGVNPSLIYASAYRESGIGTSAIAVLKNNLFGYGAGDGNAFANAKTYANIAESVDEYARVIGGKSNYTNINHRFYRGTNKGNKLSGTNVYYMSDPYSGESDTGTTFNYDATSGGIENYANTLGIKNNNRVIPVYSSPNSTSRVIYETKNYSTGETLVNIPFIVFDKVYVYENNKYQGYYKVYTDISLNSNREVDNDAIYNFNDCYGYIKEEDLYVANTQPTIEANNISITQLETIDLKGSITATDFEDGDITSKVVVEGTVDTNTIGTYKVKYTVEDSSKFSNSKEIQITVNPTNAPIIKANNIEIPQYKEYDPKKGVKIFDNNEGDLTDKLEVVENKVNVNQLGEYTVKYKATNNAGISSEKIVTIKVINNKKPVITSSDTIIKYLNDSFDYIEHVTATDFEDGDLTSRITVEGTVNTQKPGNYPLIFKVSDNDKQETVRNVNVVIEEKPFIATEGKFNLNTLSYNKDTKLVDIMGFLIIKSKEINENSISYSIIFENQYDKSLVIKNLSRLLENQPQISDIDGFSRENAWFKQSLDISDIPTGNYNVYVRARSGNFESKVPLNDIFFNIPSDKALRKFEIGTKGFEFRTNYFNRSMPFQLFVRENGLITNINNPTIDNMFNQARKVTLDGTILNIFASSYNIQGDYSKEAIVDRTITLENIKTFEKTLTKDVGSVTDCGSVQLLVPDGFDKTRAWYKTSIDLSSLTDGVYSIIVRTKTKTTDDYGELYDMLFTINEISSTVGNKRISISRASDELRFRLELKVETIK